MKIISGGCHPKNISPKDREDYMIMLGKEMYINRIPEIDIPICNINDRKEDFTEDKNENQPYFKKVPNQRYGNL